ncbi:MAG: M14 family metallopeptidase [Lutibacter sp.]|nr:M14 family metallopeptidase [Lutibacter sp.]
MKKNLFFTILFTSISFITLTAQTLKSPAEFLGYELGSQFTRHQKVVDYFIYASQNSTSIQLEKYGETNEQRPLYVSYISSEENIKNLETIQEDNLRRTGILKGNFTSEVAIVWLSYNVHGNEASSTEVAMQTLYELVTNKQDWLKNTLVIIDPCVNPDGRDRYVNWYNQTKNTPYNPNPEASEHNEPWPGGRPNHYLFDLNRDWAWATQIETQQRLKIYNKWMPQVHVDFHEQGINSPYYFAPAAEPYHEVITDWQRDFQTQIGKNNAHYFDKNGWAYFTKEFFDLLYPSYGDTYPIYMGAIGMTYEQAGGGRGGLGVTLENETVLTLTDRIAHHFTSGISTVEMTSKNAPKLIAEFKKFFNNANRKYKSYILRGDLEKMLSLKALLDKHEIQSFVSEGKKLSAYDYDSKNTKSIQTVKSDLIVSSNQPKGKMVKALFEPETKLSDSVTYDITAWSLPYAYGLKGFASETEIPFKENSQLQPINFSNTVNKEAYAYISKYNEFSDAQLLGDLLEEGFKVRFSNAEFTLEGNKYAKGSLIVMKGENKKILNFDETIVKIANNLNKKTTAVNSGMVATGFDLGSENMALIHNKKVAVLSGEGTSTLNFGEIWHFFETELKYPLYVLNTRNFNRLNLSQYDVLILPEDYNADKETLALISSYIANKGTLIAIGSSVSNFADKEGYSLKKKNPKDSLSVKQNIVPYNQWEREALKNTITGSIFKSTVDNTHPLAFGYPNSYYSLKLSDDAYNLLPEGVNVAYFPENTKNYSGFAGSDALKNIPNSLLFGVEYKGKGKIIYMVDNPLFRSFWQNGKLFFANAVFLN